MAPSRGRAAVAFLGVLLFWVGVMTAGGRVEGYSATGDYISSLAARTSPVAVLAVAALLCVAVAHAATALLVRTVWRARLTAAAVMAAGAAVVAVAAFRNSCAGGPVGCGSTRTATGDWVDILHGSSVGAYQVFTLVAMLALAVGTARGSARWPRWLGLASAVAAVVSLLLLSQMGGAHAGLWQRLWLGTNQTWLLVLAGAAAGMSRRRGPLRPTVAPGASGPDH